MVLVKLYVTVTGRFVFARLYQRLKCLISPYLFRLKKLECPASFLWGCSSGRLTTLGIHDPYGPALTYLTNGSPWVVGNLWDVRICFKILSDKQNIFVEIVLIF